MAFAPKRFLEHKYSMQVELTLNYMMEVVAFCSANNGPQIRVSKAAHGNLSESMGIGFGGRFPSSLGRHVDSSPLYIENSFDETPTECQ